MSLSTTKYALSRNLLWMSATLLSALTSLAEIPDSMRLSPVSPSDSLPGFMIEATPIDRPDSPTLSPFPSNESLYPSVDTSDLLRPNPSSTMLPPMNRKWFVSYLTPYASLQSMPGLMGIESGGIALNRVFGPVSISAWADATKIGYFRGLQTAYGFGGQFNYQISDRWALTAFGQYYSPLHPITPAMAAFMPTSAFGGYASYNFNDNWGISIGARTTRSLVTNRWELQPIVTPYYRVNKNVSFGIDIGGILYNIAKDYIDNRTADYNRHVPVAPNSVPRPSAPRIAPRR